jgi:hypothetical protein
MSIDDDCVFPQSSSSSVSDRGSRQLAAIKGKTGSEAAPRYFADATEKTADDEGRRRGRERLKAKAFPLAGFVWFFCTLLWNNN